MADKSFKPAGQIVEETAQPETAALGASGGIQNERAGHRDLTDITPGEARRLGIADKLAAGYKIGWVQSTDLGQRALGYDTVMEAEDQEAQIVMRPGSDQPFQRYDAVATLIPPEIVAQREAEEAERMQEYVRQSEEDAWPDQYDASNKDRIRVEARRQSAINRASGLIDPVHGMTLEEGLARNPDAQRREEMAAEYRRGPRHISRTEEQAARADRDREEARNTRTGRRSFAMGAGFDQSGRIVR